MEWSLSKVIRIEAGEVGVSITDLRQLLHLYRVSDPAEVAELEDLARLSRSRSAWWTRYKDLPGPYLSYIGLEHESQALRCVTPVGMPGLLQTEEFGKALVKASWWSTGTTDTQPTPAVPVPPAAGERVDVRRRRQRELLSRTSPPEITAILDEAVVWRQVGGPAVFQAQLRHLVALGERNHIIIQVLPFAAGLVNVMNPFVILEFPDESDPDVVFAESAFETALLEEAGEVATYRTVFDRLQAASLSEPESLDLISRVADGLDS